MVSVSPIVFAKLVAHLILLLLALALDPRSIAADIAFAIAATKMSQVTVGYDTCECFDGRESIECYHVTDVSEDSGASGAMTGLLWEVDGMASASACALAMCTQRWQSAGFQCQPAAIIGYSRFAAWAQSPEGPVNYQVNVSASSSQSRASQQQRSKGASRSTNVQGEVEVGAKTEAGVPFANVSLQARAKVGAGQTSGSNVAQSNTGIASRSSESGTASVQTLSRYYALGQGNSQAIAEVKAVRECLKSNQNARAPCLVETVWDLEHGGLVGPSPDLLLAVLESRTADTDVFGDLKDLVAAGYRVSAEALCTVAKQGNVEWMRALAAGGSPVDSVDGNGRTALSYAVQEQEFTLADYLLGNGAALDRPFPFNYVRAVVPSWSDFADGARFDNALLLSTTLGSGGHETLLSRAVLGGKTATARWLLSRGADAIGRADSRPLHRAAVVDSVAATRMLFEHISVPVSRYVNLRDIHGNTALHVAALFGSSEVAAELLRNGARADAENDSSEEAEHLAMQAGHTELAQMLARHQSEESGTG